MNAMTACLIVCKLHAGRICVADKAAHAAVTSLCKVHIK